MKKIFTLLLSCMCVATMLAVTVDEVSGTFKGTLNIGGSLYPNKEVYILPGAEQNTITFVLPEFKYNNAPLGDIVLVNIPIDANGKLTLENSSLYIKAISQRATIDILNGFVDGQTTYNSIVTSNSADILLSIQASTLPEPILVLFSGSKTTGGHYDMPNGGFEGTWQNSEPAGWHSFNTATGDFVSFVQNTTQFTRSTDKRPGSAGTQSAMIQTKIVVGNKANGNCTNGQINAGSMTATDASGNYNFSDPGNNGFNTPFTGNPDSLVFWAKYLPADKNPSNTENKARAHAVITTNARYQDPEAVSYASVKIADAAIDYTAGNMDWQRIAVPFNYTSLDPKTAAYVLVTFSSNYTPGGGSSYSTGGLFNKKTYLDSVYLDDVEMIYNHGLTSLTMNGNAIEFANGQAGLTEVYSDTDYDFLPTTDGKAAQAFVGYDAENSRVLVYVMADDYPQSHAYSIYTIQMAKPATPIQNTEYAYEATVCQGESYSDELFQNLTEAGEYQQTIKNAQGGDSVITLTLSVLPTYEFTEEMHITDANLEWHGKTIQNLVPSEETYVFYDSLLTAAGCDSVFVLQLYVEAKPTTYGAYEATVCQGESYSDELFRNLTEAGEYQQTIQNAQGGDSVITLTLSVLPTYEFAEEMRVNEINLEWHGKTIQNLEAQDEPYVYYDSLLTAAGCDSVFVLRVYVTNIQITYGAYDAYVCEGDSVIFEGIAYKEAYEGDITLAEKNSNGGDSVVHLTVTILPTYTIEEYRTITQGDESEWEGCNLSNMEVGQLTLTTYYSTENDCDSTIVLHLIVEPRQGVSTALDSKMVERESAKKILMNGNLYIIRKDETYNVLGTKIK